MKYHENNIEAFIISQREKNNNTEIYCPNYAMFSAITFNIAD